MLSRFLPWQSLCPVPWLWGVLPPFLSASGRSLPLWFGLSHGRRSACWTCCLLPKNYCSLVTTKMWYDWKNYILNFRIFKSCSENISSYNKIIQTFLSNKWSILEHNFCKNELRRNIIVFCPLRVRFKFCGCRGDLQTVEIEA